MEVPSAKVKVFVVDDETLLATSLALILNMNGFAATAFTSPVEALKSAEAECPEILITDFGMPQMDGINLAIQFKEAHPECRIFLFCGQTSMPSLLESARQRGYHFNVLAKPMHPKELIATISKPALP